MHIALILVFYRHLIQFLGSEMEGPGQLLGDKYWSQTYNYSITSLSYDVLGALTPVKVTQVLVR